MDALSPEEDEQQRRESQQAFGVTPVEVARPGGWGPPGTTGHWTRRPWRAGRGPACSGSTEPRLQDYLWRRPTPGTCATWLMCSVTPRRRHRPRHRTGPRSRGAARPLPWPSRRPRDLPLGPRARADRHPRNPGRARPGSALKRGAIPRRGPPWRWLPRRPRVLRGRGPGGAPSVDTLRRFAL